MPCTYDEGTRNSDSEMRAELKKVTRLLCEVMERVEKNTIGMKSLSSECKGWWNRHKELDQKRKAEEAKKQDYERRLAEWEKQRPKP